MNDLKFAFRQLLKNPGFTAVAVLTLALGIGANTAIFSVVSSVLLRPLAFKDPDRLVTVWERNVKKGYDMNQAGPATFLDWKTQNNVFESMAAFGIDEALSLTGDYEPERITAVPVSANLFEVLGVNATLGRTFREEEETVGRDQVVILSHGLWRRRFGADPNLLGKTVLLDGRGYLVVGIMPPGFVFPGMTGLLYGFFFSKPADVWIPLAMPAELLRTRSNHFLEVVARLKPDMSLTQASAEMDAVMQRIVQANPGDLMGTHAKVNGFTPAIVGVVRDVRQRSLDLENLSPQIQKLMSSQVYVSYAQLALWPKMTVVVRASSAPMALASGLRAEVGALDKDLPVSKVRTMETVRGDSIAQPRFRALLIVLFGALALALATIGIYGVMAHSVARRTHEIGVRMALGAQYSDVMKLVVCHGMVLTGIGLAVGLAGAFALTRHLSAMLYGVSATDPLTFAAVALALAGVAFCACWLPARRATKVDPMEALRCE